MTTPLARYQADLARPDFAQDAAQANAMAALECIYQDLIAAPTPKRGLFRRAQQRQLVQGAYFWGGVGRGKTYLMDCFFECLPGKQKIRSHFHRFMQEVHAQLQGLQHQQDPLEIVAQRIAKNTQVICFDEFFVNDITDAMILGNLFAGLFKRGVTLVATSNIPPNELYKDGLQRSRFLPTIDLVNQHCQVINVDGGVDYRLRALTQADIYHTPLDATAETHLARDFANIAGETGQINATFTLHDRPIQTRRMANGTLWCDFSALCAGPRGAADYIEIARQCHTVLLSNVPIITPTLDNEARRFINLVDEFYDHNVKLIMTAAAPAAQLYQGQKLSFEFQRTLSRLHEMQSHAYLALPHLP